MQDNNSNPTPFRLGLADGLVTKISFDSFWQVRKTILNGKAVPAKLQCFLLSEIDLCGPKLDKIVDAAQASFDCILSAEVFRHVVTNQGKKSKKAINRGIKHSFFITQALGNEDIGFECSLLGLPYFRVGHINDCPTEYLAIVDGKEVFFSIGSDKTGKVSLLWSTIPCLITLCQNYIDNC